MKNWILDLIAKWWPLIFVLLGYGDFVYGSPGRPGTNSSKITYDILGVFIINDLALFWTDYGGYVRKAGLIEQCRTSLISQNYELLNASDPIPVDAGLKKVIIESISRSVGNLSVVFNDKNNRLSKSKCKRLLREMRL
jgi:hypothetical protein